MKGTKTQLTNAPEGFEYYRVCDREGVCQVVRGMWAALDLTVDILELSATKSKYSRDTADIHVLDIYFYFTRLPTGATQVIAQRRGRGALSRPNHETARRKSLLSNLDLFE